MDRYAMWESEAKLKFAKIEEELASSLSRPLSVASEKIVTNLIQMQFDGAQTQQKFAKLEEGLASITASWRLQPMSVASENYYKEATALLQKQYDSVQCHVKGLVQRIATIEGTTRENVKANHTSISELADRIKAL